MANHRSRNRTRTAERPCTLTSLQQQPAHPMPVPVPAPATDVAAPGDDPAPPAALDPHGFDPSEFEWRPVPRRPRADGWTPEVQRSFIEALADTGLVSAACETVDMSERSAYRLRNAPGSEGFRRAWQMATATAADRLVDVAFSRAIEGQEEPVFDRDGVRIGSRRRYNDRLLMCLLRAYRPERFRAPEAPAHPPSIDSLAQAVTALSPAVPAQPHLTLSPERLDALVDGARGVAEVYALYPPDDREPYRRERVPDSHPVALERARLRRQREWRRAEREQLFAPEDFDPPPYGVDPAD